MRKIDQHLLENEWISRKSLQPAVSLRLAKFPEGTESEGASEGLAVIFLFEAPELDTDINLYCSRLFVPDNPINLLIAKITNEICSETPGFDLKPSD